MAVGTEQDKQLEAARALVRDVADRFDLNAWAVTMDRAETTIRWNGEDNYVWPVRGGQ